MRIHELQDYGDSNDISHISNDKIFLNSIENKIKDLDLLKKNPGNYHSQLAICYSLLRKSEECKAHAAQVPEDALPNDKAEALVAVARMLVVEKKIQEAFNHYHQAYLLKPNHGTAIEEAGWCCFELEQWQLAEEWFLKGCALEPDYEEVWEGLGRALAQQGKYDEAISSFQKAKDTDSEDEFKYFYDHLIGQCYANKKDFYRALDYYTKSVEANPTYGLALNDMAALYFNEDGDLTKAIDYLKKAESAAEEKGNAHTLQLVYINLSRIYDKLKEFDLHQHYRTKLLESLGFGGLFGEDEDEEDDELDENEE